MPGPPMHALTLPTGFKNDFSPNVLPPLLTPVSPDCTGGHPAGGGGGALCSVVWSQPYPQDGRWQSLSSPSRAPSGSVRQEWGRWGAPSGWAAWEPGQKSLLGPQGLDGVECLGSIRGLGSWPRGGAGPGGDALGTCCVTRACPVPSSGLVCTGLPSAFPVLPLNSRRSQEVLSALSCPCQLLRARDTPT